MRKFLRQLVPIAILLAAVVVGLLLLVRTVNQAPVVSGLQPGDPVPEIEAEGWLNGEPDWQGLKGKVLVVHAWASW